MIIDFESVFDFFNATCSVLKCRSDGLSEYVCFHQYKLAYTALNCWVCSVWRIAQRTVAQFPPAQSNPGFIWVFLESITKSH
jgi:hypothetical protein